MAVGKRESDEQMEWVMTLDLPKSPGHPFYRKLNEVLRESGFDRFCEQLCAPYYAEKMGRPSIPPGVYFRVLLVGYFEGIDSQRGIAWRCSDSLALREFLGMKSRQASPDHSSLTVIRKRLPVEVHEQVFAKVLAIAQERGLLKGSTVAVDSATLADTLIAAQENALEAGSRQIIEETVADKGYHAADTVAGCAEAEIRTYSVSKM
jgi:transposase